TFNIGGTDYLVPVTQTTNSDEQSNLYGIEVTATNRFTWLPGPLKNFGAKVSYNYAWSNFKTQDIRYGDVIESNGTVTPGLIPA
ncbi:hypothetical protein ABTK57_20745, partial [Acinetobacter baumannii]